jgi:excisionase family DNA binding protein
MKDLLEILTRIEKQNLEILARLSPKASRRYLSVDEAAERLNRSAWTVRQLCASGQIRAVKGDDKTWRIPADEVSRLEEDGAPRLPKRTPVSSRPLSLRGKGGRIAASCDLSYAQAT